MNQYFNIAASVHWRYYFTKKELDDTTSLYSLHIGTFYYEDAEQVQFYIVIVQVSIKRSAIEIACIGYVVYINYT